MQDAISYMKSLWNKITDSGKNAQAKDDGLKALEEFLKEQGNNVLPDKPVLPDAPKYERIDYDAPNDETIKKDAEEALGKYKNDGINGIESELNQLKKQYASQKATAEDALNSKNAAVDDAFGTAKKNADNDALKRGLARSSIAVNKKSELELSQANAKTDAYNAYAVQMGQIENDIGGLEAKREKAMNDFNLTYAAKLTENINALKTERDKKAAEALKYNNSLTEKEHEQSVDKNMKESDLYSEALSQREKENGLTGREGEGASKAVYEKMTEVLRSMNKEDARQMLVKNTLFRTNLNDYYYYLLYNEFAR